MPCRDGKDRVEEDDEKLSIGEILKKYKDEIKEISKVDIDKDLVKYFGEVNTWWVFGEVAKELDYDIFMADAENIGYKRTKRGEKEMPNDLSQTDDKGNVIIDTENLKTILDYMRRMKLWSKKKTKF